MLRCRKCFDQPLRRLQKSRYTSAILRLMAAKRGSRSVLIRYCADFDSSRSSKPGAKLGTFIAARSSFLFANFSVSGSSGAKIVQPSVFARGQALIESFPITTQRPPEGGLARVGNGGRKTAYALADTTIDTRTTRRRRGRPARSLLAPIGRAIFTQPFIASTVPSMG